MNPARTSASSSSSSSSSPVASAALESPARKDCGYASGLVWPGNSGTFEECCAIAMETNTTLTSASPTFPHPTLLDMTLTTLAKSTVKKHNLTVIYFLESRCSAAGICGVGPGQHQAEG
jgi:hypothetical protein